MPSSGSPSTRREAPTISGPRRIATGRRRFSRLPRDERGAPPLGEDRMSGELVALAEQLIGFETVDPESISEAAGFVQGWLEARGIEVERDEVRGLPVVKAEVGPEAAPTVVLHG